jgi:hypothetical protein
MEINPDLPLDSRPQAFNLIIRASFHRLGCARSPALGLVVRTSARAVRGNYSVLEEHIYGSTSCSSRPRRSNSRPGRAPEVYAAIMKSAPVRGRLEGTPAIMSGFFGGDWTDIEKHQNRSLDDVNEMHDAQLILQRRLGK